MRNPARGGVSVSLAGDTVSSTPKPLEGQPEWVSRSLRGSIYAAREAAHKLACDCRSLDAGQISHIASQFAAPWAFNRRASEQELESALAIVTDLLRAADAIERLEGPLS